MRPRSQAGFTLIELAIVLVIIGLVVGGILYGQDLIRSAQVRIQVAEIEKINTAISTFRSKYNCKPGDCAVATDYFSGVVNGNGDGHIGDGTLTLDEIWDFWNHLSSANLISGSYSPSTTSQKRVGVDSPTTILKGSGVTLYSSANYNPGGGLMVFESSIDLDTASLFGSGTDVLLITAASGPSSFLSDTGGVYPGDLMYAMDIKMDDGKPQSGQFRGLNYALGGNYNAYNTSAYSASCLDDTTNAPEVIYNLNQDKSDASMALAGYCLPVIRLQY